MPRRLALAAIPLALLAGCRSTTDLDVDISRFDAIVLVDSLDFSRFEPSSDYDYWELRSSWGPSEPPDRIVGSGGRVAREELPAAIRSELDAATPEVGFAVGCLPAFCFLFVAAVEHEQVRSYDDPGELRDFLGRISNVEEATLLVRALGFHWDERGEHTGQREIGDGWEFVVLQLVRICTPVQTDRVLLRVSRDGSVREIGRAVWERNEGMCI